MGGHGHDSHGHGHGHGDEGEEIVWHQERLLPTMLLGVLFAAMALLGLAQAGNTKLSVKMGTEAYNEIKSQMPKLEQHKASNHENSSKEEHKNMNHENANEEKPAAQKEEAKSEEHQH